MKLHASMCETDRGPFDCTAINDEIAHEEKQAIKDELASIASKVTKEINRIDASKLTPEAVSWVFLTLANKIEKSSWGEQELGVMCTDWLDDLCENIDSKI